MKKSKKETNYKVDVCLLVLFAALAFSGILIQLTYHIGNHSPDYNVMGLNRYGWLIFHKIVSVLSTVGIVIHIQLHWTILRAEIRKGLFAKRPILKHASYYFLIVFGISGILGFVSWSFNNWIVGYHPLLQHGLVEIHDKLGFILVVIFAVHLKNKMKWLVNRTKDAVATLARA